MIVWYVPCALRLRFQSVSDIIYGPNEQLRPIPPSRSAFGVQHESNKEPRSAVYLDCVQLYLICYNTFLTDKDPGMNTLSLDIEHRLDTWADLAFLLQWYCINGEPLLRDGDPTILITAQFSWGIRYETHMHIRRWRKTCNDPPYRIGRKPDMAENVCDVKKRRLWHMGSCYPWGRSSLWGTIVSLKVYVVRLNRL